jgi:hypothetical protein
MTIHGLHKSVRQEKEREMGKPLFPLFSFMGPIPDEFSNKKTLLRETGRTIIVTSNEE